MFKFVVFAALVACVAAVGPSSDDVHAEVKTLHSDVRADGFDYILDTSNHIHAEAAGDEHGNHHGSYEWLSPEGEHVKVDYVADEYGYHPQGAVLPTPHPIPAAILKAIDYINAHPHHDEYHH